MKSKEVIFVVFTPLSNADAVRHVLGQAGAGKVGDYEACSFSSRGIGRFRAGTDTDPAIGAAGAYEAVEEERIETRVSRNNLSDVIKKVRNVHPYEEVPFYVYALEDV